MESLHVASDSASELNEERGRSRLVKLVAVVSALALSIGLLAGYLFLKKRHAEQVKSANPEQAANVAKPAASPEVQIYVDDAMLKGQQTTLGGTLVNISQNSLNDLSVELELRRRKDAGTEARAVSVEPKELGPQQQGRYSLQVSSNDYSSARVLRIKSGTRQTDVPFKTSPGAQRPPERIPNKTVIVDRPSKGGGFINTPDNPTRVP
jgi:hypothetical protein